MRYFTDDLDDIEGYMRNLQTLENRLDEETYRFMVNYSFHDSTIDQLTVFNDEGAEEAEISPVSVVIQLTHWDEQKYELVWKNVVNYSTDFDITRNQVVGTGQVLYERGLDHWSHDELIQTPQDNLHHEIRLFSQTKISIECKEFSIKKIF